ncbi:MAG: hypothetical protein ACREUI_00445 [Burkholderiales bacterium]
MSEEHIAGEVEHRARVEENAHIAREILPDGGRIALYSGRCHLVMGERSAIPENLQPLVDIARVLRRTKVLLGVPGGQIHVAVNVGSPLSSPLARIWDRHGTEKLQRVGRAMIGDFVHEFDTSKRKMRVCINAEEVLEPYRIIVDEERGQEIFCPELDKHGVSQEDAFVLKVIRPHGNAPAVFSVAGLGPAGTLHGFRMLLENRRILSALANFKSKNFEVVIVIEGVRTMVMDGQKTVMATGPLDIASLKPIQIKAEDEAGILAAIKNLPRERLRALTADELEARVNLYRRFRLP